MVGYGVGVGVGDVVGEREIVFYGRGGGIWVLVIFVFYVIVWYRV